MADVSVEQFVFFKFLHHLLTADPGLYSQYPCCVVMLEFPTSWDVHVSICVGDVRLSNVPLLRGNYKSYNRGSRAKRSLTFLAFLAASWRLEAPWWTATSLALPVSRARWRKPCSRWTSSSRRTETWRVRPTSGGGDQSWGKWFLFELLICWCCTVKRQTKKSVFQSSLMLLSARVNGHCAPGGSCQGGDSELYCGRPAGAACGEPKWRGKGSWFKWLGWYTIITCSNPQRPCVRPTWRWRSASRVWLRGGRSSGRSGISWRAGWQRPGAAWRGWPFKTRSWAGDSAERGGQGELLGAWWWGCAFFCVCVCSWFILDENSWEPVLCSHVHNCFKDLSFCQSGTKQYF